MPKKCQKPAKGVRSVPQVGSQKDSQSASSTRSSSPRNKQSKKTQLTEMKATIEARRLAGDSDVPPHLVSHMLPYFYPSDYELPPEEHEPEVPRHLASHVTTYCYPVSGTIDSEDIEPPKQDAVPPHLVSHVTTFCYPVTGTVDSEEMPPPKQDGVPPHLEPHVALYCRPLNDDGTVSEWPTDTRDESIGQKVAKQEHSVPQHLKSQLSLFNDAGDDQIVRIRTGIRCDMTRNHPNMRDNIRSAVFGDDGHQRRVGGRRHVPNRHNLFEESQPKQRPMSIAIVPRVEENTKDNIFGSVSLTSTHPRKRWENTKETIFGCEADVEQAPPHKPRRRWHEDTKEKLFGETYGIKETDEEHARRQRPSREDTQLTLFGPPIPTPPPPPRPQSARSFKATQENLFGQKQLPCSRPRVQRENTFDNLFGVIAMRPVCCPKSDEWYTTKCPKRIQDSMTQVLSFEDPRHGPAPPQRRVRKAVYPNEAFKRQAAAVLSPITHDQQSVISTSRVIGPCDAHWTPALTSCRRRNLSQWDTMNTITGETLPYTVPEDRSQMREAWVDGRIQDSVAPPPPLEETTLIEQDVEA